MSILKTYAHVFDQDTFKNLAKLESSGLIKQMFGAIGSGKESYVFYAVDDHRREVAVKIHRHNIDSFRKIPAYLRLRGTKSGGFLKTIDDWTRYEFKFMVKAFKIGVNSAEPYRNYGNIITMQFLGTEGKSARLAVNDTDFDTAEWYSKIIDAIINMGKSRMIHGDLSPYNIMNFNRKPFLIDFSQALSLSASTLNFLVRDINNINTWFTRLGYKDIVKTEEIIRKIDESLV